VNVEKKAANMEKGVLSIRLPKGEERKPKLIEVKIK
jgi:HSP20 family molecular chaperone IbpA